MRLKFLLVGVLAFAFTHSSVSLAETNVKITPDIVYGHKDGLAMTMDLLEPADSPNGSCLMFVMSGGWVSTWVSPEAMQKTFQPFLDKGYKVFVVRHGSSPKYLIPEIVEDMRKAHRFVSDHATKYAFDPERIGVFGYSAGGHLSLMLGTTTNDKKGEAASSTSPKVAAVVTIFPPSDLEPYIHDAVLSERFPALKFPKEQVKDYSPLFHATEDDAPTLFIHGDKDTLVPHWHSEKMHDALKKANVPSELVIIEGAGHGFDEAGSKRALEAMLRWFDSHLGQKK